MAPVSASAPLSPLEQKRAIVRALREKNATERAALSRAQADAMAAATHEEAKPENDKDTRAIEASYLARGQAERVRVLEQESNALEFLPLRAFKLDDTVALGALVEAEVDGEQAVYFLAPCSGGERVNDVQVVTPLSPIGRALVGRTAGESLEVKIASKVRELAIAFVR